MNRLRYRLSDFPEVTQAGGGRAGIWPRTSGSRFFTATLCYPSRGRQGHASWELGQGSGQVAVVSQQRLFSTRKVWDTNQAWWRSAAQTPRMDIIALPEKTQVRSESSHCSANVWTVLTCCLQILDKAARWGVGGTDHLESKGTSDREHGENEAGDSRLGTGPWWQSWEIPVW